MATDIVMGIPATDIVVTMDILAMEAMAVTTGGDIVLTTGLILEAIMATPMVVATTEGAMEGLGLVSGSKLKEDAD
jgi:hypothetical protein